MMLKVHPKRPGGGAGKALATLDPDACKGMGGEHDALPPGKRPGTHGKEGWVGPTAKNNVIIIIIIITKLGNYRKQPYWALHTYFEKC